MNVGLEFSQKGLTCELRSIFRFLVHADGRPQQAATRVQEQWVPHEVVGSCIQVDASVQFLSSYFSSDFFFDFFECWWVCFFAFLFSYEMKQNTFCRGVSLRCGGTRS